MKNKNLTFVAIFDRDTSFLNRLIPEIRVLSADGRYTITLLLLTSIQNYYLFGKNRLALKQIVQLFDNLGIKSVIVPVKISGVSPILQLISFPYRILRTFLFFLKTKPEICHVHSIDAGILVSLLKPIFKYQIIFESHGAVVEEILLRNKYHLKFLSAWFAGLEERITVLASDKIICVSHALKLYLRGKYNKARNKDFLILPSGIIPEDYKNYSDDRENLRRSMGLNDKFIVVFSGDFHEWQKAEDIIRWYRQIRNIDKDSFFLILSNEKPEEIYDIFLLHKINEIELLIKSVSYFEIPKLLSIADLGLLPRRRLKVNEVASPLKFSEYLAAGVPVLTTPFVDQVGKFIIENQKTGFLANSVNPQNWNSKTSSDLSKFIGLIKRNRGELAYLCHISAINNFSWVRSIKLLKRLYSD